MNSGWVIPRSGIDTNARWGYSHTKVDIWIQTAYDITSSSIIVPLSTDVTTANISDNPVYLDLTLLGLLLDIMKKTHYMTADTGLW